MNIRLKKYLFLLLCVIVPVQQSCGDTNSQALLKKCAEKGIAVGKIGLGIGGIAASHVGLVAALGLHMAIREHPTAGCFSCCSYHTCKKCTKETDVIFHAYLEGMKASFSMIKENSKKLVGIDKAK